MLEGKVGDSGVTKKSKTEERVLGWAGDEMGGTSLLKGNDEQGAGSGEILDRCLFESWAASWCSNGVCLGG